LSLGLARQRRSWPLASVRDPRPWPNQSLKPSPFRVVFQVPGSGQEFAD
jgi:hypothetical protein